MITMILQGQSKLPITKIKLIAGAIGADPKVLLTTFFEEYRTENWASIQKIFEAKL